MHHQSSAQKLLSMLMTVRRCHRLADALLCVPPCAGVKQNHARRHHIPIDEITFDYSCLPAGPPPDQPPADGGAYVSGMFVEGARWDHETCMLAESEPKVRAQPVLIGTFSCR